MVTEHTIGLLILLVQFGSVINFYHIIVFRDPHLLVVRLKSLDCLEISVSPNGKLITLKFLLSPKVHSGIRMGEAPQDQWGER